MYKQDAVVLANRIAVKLATAMRLLTANIPKILLHSAVYVSITASDCTASRFSAKLLVFLDLHSLTASANCLLVLTVLSIYTKLQEVPVLPSNSEFGKYQCCPLTAILQITLSVVIQMQTRQNTWIFSFTNYSF